MSSVINFTGHWANAIQFASGMIDLLPSDRVELDHVLHSPTSPTRTNALVEIAKYVAEEFDSTSFYVESPDVSNVLTAHGFNVINDLSI
jgi:hypothetical protein